MSVREEFFHQCVIHLTSDLFAVTNLLVDLAVVLYVFPSALLLINSDNFSDLRF